MPPNAKYYITERLKNQGLLENFLNFFATPLYQWRGKGF